MLMKQVMAWLGKGMLAVLPALVTIYAIVWFFGTLEGLLATPLQWLLGESWYLPGLGLAVGLGLLIGVGVLVDAYIGRWFLDLMERVVDRVPVVKSIYGAVRDVLQFALPGQRQTHARRVVAWQLQEDTWLVGFLTGPAFVDPDTGQACDVDPSQEGDAQPAKRVAVYFPMSYQIGGYTLLLPESELVTLDIGVEQAMKGVLSAGVVNTRRAL